MKLRPAPFFLILLGAVGLVRADPAPAEEGDAGPQLTESKAYDPDGGKERTLRIIPIDETIDLGLASFVDRMVAAAQENDIIVVKIKTFGGRVDAAVRIRDALLDSPVPTVAYVDRRAISAGALITLACDTIIMSPGSSIGAATPVHQGEEGKMEAADEKVVSYMRAEMRATAEAKGRRTDLAEAMVDADVAVKGVVPKGKLLTLTGTRARELKLSDASAENFDRAMRMLNLGLAKRLDGQTHWAEKLARFLTDPTISSLLMSLGFLALMIELYTPTFGAAGIIGATCLALFFFGQHTAHLAGFEEILVFVIGVGLLVVEVFVIPGFGLAGFAGLAAIVTALVMAMVEVDIPISVSFELGYVQDGLTAAALRVLVALALAVVGMIVLARYLPSSRFGSWMVFKSEPSRELGSDGGTAGAGGESFTANNSHLLGKVGIAKTVLRPTGIAAIEGERVQVTSDGDYVDAGTRIEVTSVDGHRVLVRTASAPLPESSSDPQEAS